MSDHYDVHERAREIVQTISEGMNCMANLRKRAKAIESPPPECLAELDDMERAFVGAREGVRNGSVETDLVVDDGLIAAARAVRGLASDWLKSGQVPKELIPQLEGLLERLGVPLSYLDSEV